MVKTIASGKILKKTQVQHALISIVLLAASSFGLYIVYDTVGQYFNDVATQGDIILVPYGYVSLVGAIIVVIWFAFALVYEKVANKPVESSIIRITKIVFMTGLGLMILSPILFKTISESQLGENGYIKCNTYESRGTNKWVKDKNLC